MSRVRRLLYGTVIAAAMVAALLWCAGGLVDAREQATRARADLGVCRQLAARIGQLDRLPRSQSAGPVDPSDLYQHGQQALQQLGVSPDHLVQIAPQTPERLGETAYKQVPTQLLVRDLTLRQLVGFLLAMTSEPSTMSVRSLRLYAPRDSDGGAQWTAELTLSYLVYEPPAAVSVVKALERNE
jgi:hypothetical protein